MLLKAILKDGEGREGAITFELAMIECSLGSALNPSLSVEVRTQFTEMLPGGSTAMIHEIKTLADNNMRGESSGDDMSCSSKSPSDADDNMDVDRAEDMTDISESPPDETMPSPSDNASDATMASSGGRSTGSSTDDSMA